MFYTLSDFDFNAKRVLVRVDFNVPQDSSGNITDDSRIRKALPTINLVLDKNPQQVIVCSHLGRPEGKINSKYSMKPIAQRFKELLGQEVYFESNPEIRKLQSLNNSKIIVLENLRFDPGEEAGDREFAEKLASFADLFVFDAFGVAHRAHASVTGVPKFLKSCAGQIMENEVKNLDLTNPEQPFIAIIGGAKADKIDVMRTLLAKVDKLILGGVLANTFLKARGTPIGASRYDEETLKFAKEIIEQAKNKIVFPLDALLGNNFSADADSKMVDIQNVENGWLILDIGPRTVELYKSLLQQAKTIFWAGPIGVFEFDRFANGTKEVALTLAECKARTIIGGGDSGAAIEKYNLGCRMTWISTGGGASLEYISGKQLPGIVALQDNYKTFKG
ncbi:phosphoglycerate kinase [Candidatus Woesearchaeota archaeon]|nr:phosphoglycerate kinase [Candidatus Woesearchaeota archaeon]